MVKFGNVDNYIVGVWTEADLEACAELNLPCANVVGHLPRPLGSALAPDSQSVGSEKTGASSEGYDIPDFGSREFNAIMWTKPAVVKHLLDLGYAVHSSGNEKERKNGVYIYFLNEVVVICHCTVATDRPTHYYSLVPTPLIPYAYIQSTNISMSACLYFR